MSEEFLKFLKTDIDEKESLCCISLKILRV